MCNINCFYLSTGTHSQEEKSRCQMAPVSLSAVTASSSPMLTWWQTREGSEWSSPTVTCTTQLFKMLIQWRTSPPLKSLQGWVYSFYSIESAFFSFFFFFLLSSIIIVVKKIWGAKTLLGLHHLFTRYKKTTVFSQTSTFNSRNTDKTGSSVNSMNKFSLCCFPFYM